MSSSSMRSSRTPMRPTDAGPRAALAVALGLVLALAACGESAEDRAQSTVCSARADIKKQVDELKSTTVTTASIDGVKSNLKSISDSVSTIAGAQGDLKGDRKAAVEQANQA